MSNPQFPSDSDAFTAPKARRGARRLQCRRLNHYRVVTVFIVPCILSLSAHGNAQVTWNGKGNNGLWDAAANWTSAPALPGSSDNVFNHTNQSITHSSGMDTIRSFLSDGTGAFYLTGGMLAGSQLNSASTFQVNGIFNVNGGSLSNLTINPGSGGQGVTFT